ncbi:alpha/beta hydrolase-fold protein [Fulvivirga lutimaris]|uniref:alpha/beta hydrolase-fold protein n=1 Tax=Fulvivirga lutimaris TaxID=1819566 RepID=UPI0012BB8201|nr:alpha/beta hydrolase-fold protein [Fulvivirga lutimaris]MTI40610.1 esterase [Fulvivirga lutimaris]
MLKQHFLLILIVSLFVSNSLLAQSAMQVGELKTFYSEILGTDRTIQVYLPDSYDDSERKYATLYVLDGQMFFLNGVAIQKSLHGETLLPEMIVIGLVMEQPERNEVFRNQWDEFKAFVQKELVGYIDQNFRTNGERILFGWETSAYVSAEVIMASGCPFTGAISSNAAYIDQNMIDSFNKQVSDIKYLYLANTEKDIYTIASTTQAVENLKANDIDNLVWDVRLFNDEIHESLPYLSMYHGLKFYYHNYASPSFSSIKDFEERGGLPYLNDYFKQRGERFGMSQEIDYATKNTLIWMAWNQDEFSAFKQFMTEFEDVLGTPRYASAYWQNRLGQYYLKYEDFDSAIPFFERGIRDYPDDEYMAQMYSGLGLSYLGNDDKKRAKQNLKLAVQAAEKTSDQNLDVYKEQLKKVK